MPAVDLVIQTQPPQTEEIEFVPNLERTRALEATHDRGNTHLARQTLPSATPSKM